MSAFTEKLKYEFRTAGALQRLLMVNVAVFLVVRIVNSLSVLFMVPIFDFYQVSKWLAVPAEPANLLFHPWTLITYMFYHWDFMHIFFNMLWLYWMGQIFEEYQGSKKLVSTYFLGGLSGALLYIIAYNVFPLFAPALSDSFALGASASVLAITVAAATLVPEYPVHLLLIGRVPLKWIAAVTILLDVINISGSNAGGHIAHIGGALFGFISIRQLRRGNDITLWFQNLTGMNRKPGRGKMKVSHSRKKSDEDYNVLRKSKQERLDEILDKIGKSGYGSLSQEERDFLFTESKEKK